MILWVLFIFWFSQDVFSKLLQPVSRIRNIINSTFRSLIMPSGSTRLYVKCMYEIPLHFTSFQGNCTFNEIGLSTERIFFEVKELFQKLKDNIDINTSRGFFHAVDVHYNIHTSLRNACHNPFNPINILFHGQTTVVYLGISEERSDNTLQRMVSQYYFPLDKSTPFPRLECVISHNCPGEYEVIHMSRITEFININLPQLIKCS